MSIQRINKPFNIRKTRGPPTIFTSLDTPLGKKRDMYHASHERETSAERSRRLDTALRMSTLSVNTLDHTTMAYPMHQTMMSTSKHGGMPHSSLLMSQTGVPTYAMKPGTPSLRTKIGTPSKYQ